ncbi:MAG: hydroxymethylbilane synthase [Acidobacteria bacterium]|nr:hydroxymethylbilane synthase [Acidobacteriota bacterium]
MKPLRLGTRRSPLALWQTRQVAAALRRAGAPEPELVTITTDGDRLSAAPRAEAEPLPAGGGKRLFVKAIEDALLGGRIDLAVHSAKDLPAVVPAGLRIEAVLPRADPRDALAAPATATGPAGGAAAWVARAGPGARVGTSSLRRAAQLRRAFPDIEVVPVRGNVGTRLRRLDEGGCDLLVLAVAGLVRLGLSERISSPLAAEICVPAPGQGIVAAECRIGDAAAEELLERIRNRDAAQALDAERALVTALDADCNVPLGALATADGDRLSLRCVVASPDGGRLLGHIVRGRLDDASGVGRRAADLLLADGAAALLAAAGTT